MGSGDVCLGAHAAHRLTLPQAHPTRWNRKRGARNSASEHSTRPISKRSPCRKPCLYDNNVTLSAVTSHKLRGPRTKAFEPATSVCALPSSLRFSAASRLRREASHEPGLLDPPPNGRCPPCDCSMLHAGERVILGVCWFAARSPTRLGTTLCGWQISSPIPFGSPGRIAAPVVCPKVLGPCGTSAG